MNSQQVQDIYLMYEAVYNDKLREKAEEYNNPNDLDEDAQKIVGQALDAAAKNPVIKAIGSVIAPAGKGRKTPTSTSGGYRPVKEDVDIFDVILEHLVAEGYADTNEAALAIMANMSEEWKQSIVEGDALQNTIKRLEGKRDAMNREKPGSANTAAPGKQSVGAATYSAYQRLRGV
jgi:hypothetical protein